jgi:predicted KAP-like P-loop ATPase
MGSERFRGSFFPPISWLLNRVVAELLERIPKSDRLQSLRDAFRKSESIGAMMWFVHTLGQEHGKYGAEKPAAAKPSTISVEELQELEGLALDKVRAAAKSGNLLEIPNLALVLRDWEACVGLDEVRKWVQESVDDDASLPRLLCAILSAQYANGKLEYRLDPEWLQSYIDPSSIFDRAEKIAADTSLPELQRTAAGQFVLEFEIRRRGENPSDPFQR